MLKDWRRKAAMAAGRRGSKAVAHFLSWVLPCLFRDSWLPLKAFLSVRLRTICA